jgi:hypothetical protein
MFYNVLTPVYRKTGEKMEVAPGTFKDVCDVSWKKIGVADSMEEAKERFGGYPVLEKA